MDSLTVLVTGAGSPGIKGTLYSLSQNFDNRTIRTIGTDIKQEVIGKYICDKFYCISRPSEKGYLDQLLSICEQECVDVLLPQNTAELSVLAEKRSLFSSLGTSIAVSDASAISIANDKFKLMKLAEHIDVPTAKYTLVNNFDSLVNSAYDLGWPEIPIVVKPPLSNGMRGVRIINESLDLKKMFYSEKPTSLFVKMDQLHEILGSEFFPLLVMEYLPGVEYSVDVLKARKYTIVPRKRDAIRSGITFHGTVEYHENIIANTQKLSEATGLDYVFGFQFKMDNHGNPKLLESNPRVQGTMVLSTFAGANLIYAAVKRALNEEIPDFRVNWGTKIFRYWGGIGVHNESNVGFL
ncbi:carbamoyl-phosphate synthase large subunit [Methanomicrobium sp. W14]|uniref:ATP-grasp domain-containing protein n=1 Tax=Methanomicrobium sp. W14 TaxID=2817839 RepID=UPI001AE7B355|nr:ATP-grasp domain-containing protein [Methanomicrobium sp. W14]MBP2133107.1 carbamoyl-phosphate synthase large subunit [Methanomicrobium sp. W14]